MHSRPALLLVLLALLPANTAVSGTPFERGAARVDQALRDLAGDRRALFLAVRPDRVDYATLALLRRRDGVRTTIVTFTRGEGGESEIGDDRHEGLAVVRTAEAIAAADRVGADVVFLDLPDQGDSRTADETLSRWDRAEALRRLVREVRARRPDLILVGRPAPWNPGAGAAAEALAEQAFDAAVDETAGAGEEAPFAARKLYVAAPSKEADVEPPVTDVEPLRGLTYAEMGRLALAEHRTQGAFAGEIPATGPGLPAYRLVRSRVATPAKAFLAGIPAERQEWLGEEARSGTRLELLRRVLALPESPARRAAVAALAGVELEVHVPEGGAVPGGSVAAAVEFRNRGPWPLEVDAGGDSPFPPDLRGPGTTVRWTRTVEVPPDAVPNRPLLDHLREPPGGGTIVRAGVRVRLAVEGEPEGGVELDLAAAAEVPVWPPVTVQISERGRLFRPVIGTGELAVIVTNHTAEERELELAVAIEGTDRVVANPPEAFTVAPGASRTVPVGLSCTPDVEPGLYRVEVRAGPSPVASAPLRVLDVGLADVHIAVVRTAGEEAWAALRDMGVRPDLLSDEELLVADLRDYDSIWVGVRPFTFRPVLKQAWPRLLDFAKGGGMLVVNACRPEEWSPAYAPYPLRIGREAVTREEAPVQLLETEHRLLRFPNVIESEDFDGWVRDRGAFFPAAYDTEHYQALLETADPGGRPLPGLLFAEYGYGTFVYTSMSWFRQLAILDTAALKMLANLMSYPWIG